MMRITKWLLPALIVWRLALTVHGEPIQTLDLHSFVGASAFDNIGAPWLLPHGRQVLDGTPFQIDGAILLYGSNNAEKAKPARTNVNDIPVSQRFERLHLLTETHFSTTDGTTIAKIHFLYADGSNT